jgi:hypothetical protein
MKKIIFSIIFMCFVIFLSAQSKKNFSNNESHNFMNFRNTMIFWESFEGAEFPPLDWSRIINDVAYTWEKDSSYPLDGQYFVHVLYDEVNPTNLQDEWLITKSINLSGYETAILNFYFQMSKYWGIYPYDNYDLYVIAAADGVNFTDTLWSEMSTDTSTWTSWEWVNAEVDLTNYIGSNSLKLAFVYYGRDGAEGSIDAISISTTGGLNDNVLQSLQAYPNPTSDFLYLKAPVNTEIHIYDILGNEIYYGIINENLYKIDLQPHTNGIYILKLKDNNTIKTIKIVKN